MYKNYGGVKVRLNYGDKDYIRGYHEDLNRIWPELMSNYEWKIYDAAHSTCGLGEMFGFLQKAFESPLARPSQWDHIDVYPDFSVWGYDVRTDRNIPGFTILENVDRRGFKCSVREFLPTGELLPFVNVSITTSPAYEKNAEYVIQDIDTRSLKNTQQIIRSDNQGKLIIQLNGSSHEIGINKKGDKPNIRIASVEIQKYWRTELYSTDPYVNPFGVAERKSDYWGNYDHVGASAKFDIPLIASNCPENHTIDFFAEYWLPDNPLHIIRQGVVKIEVKGRDATAPQIQWVQVTGENVVRAKIFDGSKIQSAKTKLILKNDPMKSFEVELNDDGNGGDGTAGDNVYSKKLPIDKFGIYRVVIEAIDSHGNKMIYERSDDFVLH